MKLKDHTVDDYILKLASNAPAPGGGSASAVVVSLGASLGEMVAGILLGRKKVENKEKLEALQGQFSTIKEKAKAIIDEDAVAYENVIASYKTDKEGDEKKAFIDGVLKEAYEVMYRLSELAKEGLEAMTELEHLGTKSIMNDVKVGRSFLQAGYEGAYSTAMINVEYIDCKELKAQLTLKICP